MKNKKTIKNRRKAIEKKIDNIDEKYYKAKRDLEKKLERLHEECKKQGSIKNKVNINTMERDERDGTHVEVEPLNIYFVDDEEWITIKVTTTRTSDGPRRKTCFRLEEPGEDWEHHH